jgi:hypothetical protein
MSSWNHQSATRVNVGLWVEKCLRAFPDLMAEEIPVGDNSSCGPYRWMAACMCVYVYTFMLPNTHAYLQMYTYKAKQMAGEIKSCASQRSYVFLGHYCVM